ncbi:putative nucleotide-diphospho-sugar transferase [Oceanobacter sp. 5_MG-2023]|uniref:putative nucleotide-diphospho-sugar transferase n=1 Tax=Oceanobacter sp. 5_MG-2023 TaxID=3062645 RepID=UPI0026E3747C|nr:putative nucleotide-diphospho-sugar transferase [Oceanobacter sp. 5_MG-2023]MDO6680823.1 putative nucleotide-diphospho-sugar transferase [Oceanobacter sp. 5_MG-2023]
MNGFVYAATGDIGYTQLAIRSARSLKAQCPDYPIDLFTDQPCDDDVFDQVHVYEDSWFRAKIDALQDSRFEKTVYIDADTFVIDDISDVFFILDRFDIAAVHDQARASHHGQRIHKLSFPESFPALNSGVVGIRKTEETTAFLNTWKRLMQETGSNADQPLFRELIWLSNLHVHILPTEYNVMHLHWLRITNQARGFPKIIHSPSLHHFIDKDGEACPSLLSLLGYRTMRNLIKTFRAKGTHNLEKVPQEFFLGNPSDYSLINKIKYFVLSDYFSKK